MSNSDSVNQSGATNTTSRKHQNEESASPVRIDEQNGAKVEPRNSIDDLPLPFEDYGPPLPPDGGWGWVVAMACFLINLIVDGVCYTFGIFFGELIDYFDTSTTKAALAGSLVPATYLIVGPIVSSLANKFGCKKVAISGSILSCFAFCICIFSPTIEVMMVTYGVLGGMGFGLMYLPSIVMVGFYFDKKRALATGIAVCGSGIGTFLFAPLGNFLVETYGWKGANIIIAAISLHGIPCALAFRPLQARRVNAVEQSKIIQSIVEEKKRRRTVSTGSLDGSVITKENRLIKEQIALASRDVIPEVEIEEGTVTTPTRDEKPSQYGDDKKLKSIQEAGDQNTSLSSLPQSKQLERVRNMDVGVSNRSIPQQSNRSMGSSSSVTYRGPPLAPTGEEKRQLESPFARQDIFYAGSVTTLSEYKESKDMASYVQSITSIAGKGAPGEEYEEKKACKWMPSIVSEMLDFSLLTCFTFIVLCLAGVFVFVGLYTPFVYVSKKAESLGVDKSKASLIISVLGIFNTVSRLIAGWLADRPWSDCLVIHNVAAILAGLATCAVPLLNTFELLMAYAVAFGTCIAAFIALRSIVLVELLGIQRLTNSFGLTALFQGIAVLLGSPVSGALFDATQSYTLPFLFSGSMIALGGLVCLPARRIAKWENSKGEYKKVDPPADV